MPPASHPRRYEIRQKFRAPLEYVFAWCTDYTTEDPRLEGERYQRQILARSRRRVVYEDLTDSPGGWMWSRQTVTLMPPDRWTAEANGNYRSWKLDYRLRALPGHRTELRLVGLRRATPLGAPNPARATLERELRLSWRRFARAAERAYRQGRPAREPRGAPSSH